MGQLETKDANHEETVRAFTQAMLADLRALEQLLPSEMIERRVRRIGVEQEMFLVDAHGLPAAAALEVLAAAQDPRLTTELALFNLEANLPPQQFTGGFLRQLESELQDVHAKVDATFAKTGARPLLTGILPSLRQADLELPKMTPKPRYRQLNDALVALNGGHFSIAIHGIDEFELLTSSVMFEAANTSFQLHLQVEPEEFAPLYNLAQLISAPLLAAAVNSPLFLGKRLWQETRVALFERSVDARTQAERARGRIPRVTFGSGWVKTSVLELFQEAISRFPVAVTCEPGPPPLAELAAGRVPRLAALLLHNGTVWRWNRACYGVAADQAHLRIENRILPAGPSILDQVANAALFYGLMQGLQEVAPGIPLRLSFDAAKSNFVQAARLGLGAQFSWLDGRWVSAKELLLEELLPVARSGLAAIAVPADDVDRYLGTLEERVRSERTGARWLLDSLASLRQAATSPAAANARLAATLLELVASGDPVHRWPVAVPAAIRPGSRTVADIMTTDVFTVRPEDVVDLATSMMEWRHFRHVPVEAMSGELVGLVSPRALLRLGQQPARLAEPVSIAAIMETDPPRVAPETPLLTAMHQLLANPGGCLLVVTADHHLVGIVTERDFLRAAAELIAE